MDYLAFLKTMDTGKAEGSNRSTAVTEPCNEINESNEKSPIRPELAPCGSPECGGCYEVIHPDSGLPVKIHPPKASAEWKAWLERWQPKGKAQ